MSKKLYDIVDYSNGQAKMNPVNTQGVWVSGQLTLDKPLTQESYDKYMSSPYKFLFVNHKGREALVVGSNVISWNTDDPNTAFEDGGKGTDHYCAPMLDFLEDVTEDYKATGAITIEDDFGGTATYNPETRWITYGGEFVNREREDFDWARSQEANFFREMIKDYDQIPDVVDMPIDENDDEKQYGDD